MRSVSLEVVRSAALLLTGVFAGGVLFTVLAPSLRALPGSAYVRHWQALNDDYARAMPPLLLTCVALLGVTCVLSWRRGWTVTGLAITALVLVVVVVVLTVTTLEPLNRVADAWDPDALPADWSATRDRWHGLHLVRTGLALTAFVVLLTAAAIDDGRPDRGTPAAGSAADARPVVGARR